MIQKGVIILRYQTYLLGFYFHRKSMEIITPTCFSAKKTIKKHK